MIRIINNSFNFAFSKPRSLNREAKDPYHNTKQRTDHNGNVEKQDKTKSK